MDMLQQRAAAARSNPGTPNGGLRYQPFPGEIRSATEIVNGQERTKLVGYASVTEKRYPMWDMFGEYDEIVDQRAFDATLARSPDVNYVVNHTGLSMARTGNGTLTLAMDSKGLHTEAFVNPKRNDVSDLLHAVNDGDVREMSFKFGITDGEWSEDFSEFRILQVELDKGDVSVCNFGANPFTDVAARQTQLLRDVPHLPDGALREVIQVVGRQLKTEEVAESRATMVEVKPEAAVEEAPVPATIEQARANLNEPTGRSIDLVRRLLDLQN
jgi:HK97 family phage prohead protease